MMRIRRKGTRATGASGHDQSGSDRWLLSYADFMTLLLALFVVLYASARADESRDGSLFEGLQAAFIFSENSPAPILSEDRNASSENATKESITPVPLLAQLEADLVDLIDREVLKPGEEPGMSLRQTERGLVVTLASTEFFPAGGVEIPLEQQEALSAMATFLNTTSSSILFEGHTDAVPIQGGAYPSNWELSSARAAAVARFFIDEHALEASRVATIGYAAQRPVAGNQDAGNRARNRRVEIVILEDGVLVAQDGGGKRKGELDQLLELLPPIPVEADATLKAPPPGPAPKDIPLP